MLWLWTGLGVVVSVPVAALLLVIWLHFYLCWRYLGHVVRIFQERPLFIVPRGQPVPGAEDVRFRTADGLTLVGTYFRAEGPRRGVLLFGLEFGSNRWACLPYCEHLLAHGYDVFAYESRNQGESESLPGYDPLPWVTEYEVRDMEAALAYLRSRPDADPGGIGLFGISKGGSVGIAVAARDPYVRCVAVDGVFATHIVMVPYMRKWFGIYNNNYWLQQVVPLWYYGQVGLIGLRRIERLRGCRFVHIEKCIHQLAPRPLLMIHGGSDTYVKPEMARALFERAREPKELWIIDGAKHNQNLHVAGEEYRRRTLEFFDRHLAKRTASLVHGGAVPASATGPVADEAAILMARLMLT
ncbi:MAG: alpha/beta fold hydrolase [Gemmataceae bacterium]|nr:alpha/beta fold hydrolase [Gemmataceae bacterium]MDW8263906.1 alpha/beta fold hydrolase [Gemmataceae bacterium]